MFLVSTITGLKALASLAASRDEMIALNSLGINFKPLTQFRQNALTKGRDAVQRMIDNSGGLALPTDDVTIVISNPFDDPHSELITLFWAMNRPAQAQAAVPPYYLEVLRYPACLKVDDAWSQANDVLAEMPDNMIDDGEGTPQRLKKWSEWGDPAAHVLKNGFRWIELATRRDMLAGSLLGTIDAIDPTDVTSNVRPMSAWPVTE